MAKQRTGTAKRKNPADATVRNVRASLRRDVTLATLVRQVSTQIARLAIALGEHEARLRALEAGRARGR
jgi:hypothetical protein